MRLRIRHLLFGCSLVWFTLATNFVWAQDARDCPTNQRLCGTNFTQATSWVGNGLLPNEIAGGCFTEQNGAFYSFVADANGSLVFTINPLTINDNYDWILYDITGKACEDLNPSTGPALLPLSCNGCNAGLFVGTPTGMSLGGTGVIVNPVPGCDNFNTTVFLTANKKYLLYIANQNTTPPLGGFDLDFNGTTPGTFITNPPSIVSVGAVCGSDSITVTFDKNVDCESLQLTDFRLRSTAGTVLFPTIITCSNTGISKVIGIKFNARLSRSDQYRLSRLFPVTDYCGQVVLDTVFTFSPGFPVSVDAGSNVDYCQGTLGVQLNAAASGGSTPNYAYSWSPNLFISATNIRNPIVNPGVSLTYYVEVLNGGCLSARDSVRVTSVPKPTVNVQGPQSICRGTPITLFGQGPETCLWLPSGINSKSITFAPLTDTLIRVIPFTNGCPGDTVNFPITVVQTPNSNFTITGTACTFDAVLVQLPGGAQPGAIYNWNFDGGLLFSGSGVGPYQVYWPFVGVKNITLTVTDGSTCVGNTVKSVQVGPRPGLDAGPDFSICERGSVRLLGQSTIASGCSYQWVPADGLDNPFVLQPLAAPLVTTRYYLIANCSGCNGTVDSVLVTVRPRPLASVPAFPQATCLGSGGVTLNGGGSGGTGPFQYFWFPGNGLSNPFVANPTANPSDTTRYFLLVTDSTGCNSDTASVLVIVNPTPTLNAGPDIQLCTGDPGDTLRAEVVSGGTNSGLLWQWSPTAGLNDPTLRQPVARPTVTTIYTVQATDPLTGCTSFASDTGATVVVRVGQRPTARAGFNKAICIGDGILIGDNPANVGSNVSFIWSPSTGLSDSTVALPIASPRVTTTYFVKVISDGCESEADSVTVSIVASPTVVINQNLTEVCPGEVVTLTTQVVNGRPPYTYLWTPSAGLSDPTSPNPIANPTGTTTYTLVVTATGCDFPAVDSVLVQVAPTVVLEADSNNLASGLIYCQGDAPIRLPAKVTSSFPVSVTWTPATGLSNPNIIQPFASPTVTTQYVLSSTLGRCVFRDTVLVNVKSLVVASIQTDSNAICVGQSTLLRASGGVGSASFTWTPTTGLNKVTGATVRARPTVSTLYIVTVSEGGCSDTESVYIQVSPNVTAKFSQTYARGCSGLQVVFQDSSIGANAWEWDFGDNTPPSNLQNPNHFFFAEGTYSVKLRAFANSFCSDLYTSPIPVIVTPGVEADFVSTPPLDSILRTPIAVLNLTDTSRGTPVQWLWQFGDGTLSNEQNPRKLYSQLGDFYITLTATDSAGCTDTIRKGPYRVRESFLEVQNVFTPNGDGVNDQWRANYNGPESYELHIYDRWGLSVFTANSPTQAWNGSLNGGSPAAEGQYFYAIHIGGRIQKGSISLIR
jgi:gliding motility-associated-like protein